MMQNDSFICVVCFRSWCNQPSESLQELHFWSLALYPWHFCNSGTSFARQSVISCDISDILTTDYMLSSGQKHAKHHLVSVLRLSSPDFSTILQQSCQEEIQKFDVVRWFSCSAGLTAKPFRIWFQDVSTTPSKLPSFVQLCTWACLKMVVKWLLNGY